MSDTIKSNQSPQPITHCPSCQSVINTDAKTHPFCSERCRLADLGNWFNESYKISRGLKPVDLDEFDS